MRHGDKINNLGRKKAHRVALLQNLASQLITHKRIVTTLAKAKALRTYVEPLITKTKKNESAAQISHNHRLVFAELQDKAAVKELFTVVGPKIASRPGGYTRILKLGIRPGDNAEKAMIELVDFNEIYGKSVEKLLSLLKRLVVLVVLKRKRKRLLKQLLLLKRLQLKKPQLLKIKLLNNFNEEFFKYRQDFFSLAFFISNV